VLEAGRKGFTGPHEGFTGPHEGFTGAHEGFTSHTAFLIHPANPLLTRGKKDGRTASRCGASLPPLRSAAGHTEGVAEQVARQGEEEGQLQVGQGLAQPAAAGMLRSDWPDAHTEGAQPVKQGQAGEEEQRGSDQRRRDRGHRAGSGVRDVWCGNVSPSGLMGGSSAPSRVAWSPWSAWPTGSARITPR
jgi:hypothetical protein